MMDCWIIGKDFFRSMAAYNVRCRVPDVEQKRCGASLPTALQNNTPTLQQSNYAKRAFTMVELLVVLAIIVVITTISIPTIDAMTSPKHALRKEGRKIMLLMTEARMASMSRKMQIDLRIDPETREIRMVEAASFRAISTGAYALSFSEAETNRYEKTVTFDESYELDSFTADQIFTGDDEDDSPFSEQKESRQDSSDESAERLAVSFLHFGGSSGGGISLVQDGVRIDIAADVLTGRPKVVKRIGELD
jgi:prepilin-type N-terminal cleavage/methylation domain-containing protein